MDAWIPAENDINKLETRLFSHFVSWKSSTNKGR